MAIGECQFLTCRSMIGSPFRGLFFFVSGESEPSEVLLCPQHERMCRATRDGQEPGRVCMTEEGWVYLSMTMDSIGFTV